MQKQLLEIVNDFSQWRGNSYTLANVISEFVKAKAAQAIEQEFPEAAEIVKAL